MYIPFVIVAQGIYSSLMWTSIQDHSRFNVTRLECQKTIFRWKNYYWELVNSPLGHKVGLCPDLFQWQIPEASIQTSILRRGNHNQAP